MGCSPPASWYEAEAREYVERRRRAHEREVGRFLNLLASMSDEQKAAVRRELYPEDDLARVPDQR